MDLKDQLSARLVKLKEDRAQLVANLQKGQQSLNHLDGAIAILEEQLAVKPEKPAKAGK